MSVERNVDSNGKVVKGFTVFVNINGEPCFLGDWYPSYEVALMAYECMEEILLGSASDFLGGQRRAFARTQRGLHPFRSTDERLHRTSIE